MRKRRTHLDEEGNNIRGHKGQRNSGRPDRQKLRSADMCDYATEDHIVRSYKCVGLLQKLMSTRPFGFKWLTYCQDNEQVLGLEDVCILRVVM